MQELQTCIMNVRCCPSFRRLTMFTLLLLFGIKRKRRITCPGNPTRAFKIEEHNPFGEPRETRNIKNTRKANKRKTGPRQPSITESININRKLSFSKENVLLIALRKLLIVPGKQRVVGKYHPRRNEQSGAVFHFNKNDGGNYTIQPLRKNSFLFLAGKKGVNLLELRWRDLWRGFSATFRRKRFFTVREKTPVIRNANSLADGEYIWMAFKESRVRLGNAMQG